MGKLAVKTQWGLYTKVTNLQTIENVGTFWDFFLIIFIAHIGNTCSIQ